MFMHASVGSCCGYAWLMLHHAVVVVIASVTIVLNVVVVVDIMKPNLFCFVLLIWSEERCFAHSLWNTCRSVRFNVVNVLLK